MAKRTREEWLGLFKAQLDSGLTARQFCRRQGIDPNYFCRRKGQIGRDREPAGKAVGFVQLKPPAPVIGTFEVRVGAEVRSHMRRSRGRPALPEDLPREEIVYDLSKDEKLCPYDGAALKLIGDERSEQLEIIPATFKVICLPLLRAIRGHRNQAQATPGQEHCRARVVGLYRHRQVPRCLTAVSAEQDLQTLGD